VDSRGRTIFVADSHRDGQRFIVLTDEKLTAFRHSLKNQGQSAFPSLNIER
jgi:hypothetical protein